MAEIEPSQFGIAGMTCEIRSARVEDAAKYLRVAPQIYAETVYMLREEDEFQMTLDEEIAYLAGRSASPCDLALVAMVDGLIVGGGGLTGSRLKRFRHQAEIGIGILKAYWGKGIGSALMRALVEWAESNGVLRLTLKVAETNERAIRLYRKFGFVEEGRMRMDRCLGPGHYEDTVVMARISEC